MKINVQTVQMQRYLSATWLKERKTELRRATVRAFRDEMPALRERLRGNMRQAFQLKRPQFANVMTYKLYDQRPNRLPAAKVGALRAPWLESHEVGGTIRGKGKGMLIPLNLNKRMGGAAFKRVVRGLMASHNAFFKNVDGKVLLFAENVAETRALTSRFRRGYRKSLGVKRLARNVEIPIAILVPSVRLRKRLQVQKLVAQTVPRIVTRIQQSMRRR